MSRTNIVKSISTETKVQIAEDYQSEDFSTKKSLAEKYNISVRTLGRILDEVIVSSSPEMDYCVTKNEITIIKNGDTRTVNRSFPSFNKLKKELSKGCYSDTTLLSVFDSMCIKNIIATFSEGNITVNHEQGTIHYGSFEIKNSLVTQIMRLLDEGKPVTNMVKFLDKLLDNPKGDIVEELYGFMQYTGITIDEDGDIIAFKGVKNSYRDVYTGKISNKEGEHLVMPRAQVQYDPSQGCGSGLHAGSYKYAKSWGERVMKVKIDPRDVVSVPYDCSAQKMRTCGYKVLEEIK